MSGTESSEINRRAEQNNLDQAPAQRAPDAELEDLRAEVRRLEEKNQLAAEIERLTAPPEKSAPDIQQPLLYGNTLEQGTDTRIALVIGNGNYKTAPLINPVNDANDVVSTLKGIGFKVIHLTNANKREMVAGINQFGKELQSNDVGLFYYAGHGMQIKGSNYLIPIDANVESEGDIEFEFVDANRLLAKIEYFENKVNIVVLDACRNNPFARSFRSNDRGLARLDAPTGTFIAFATSPGQSLRMVMEETVCCMKQMTSKHPGNPHHLPGISIL